VSESVNLVRRPGIAPETLAACGINLVNSPEPGSIEIPYYDIEGRATGFKRWRLPKERPNGQKYHQLPNSGVHVYFPPFGSPHCTLVDLVITEGEFKSISLREAGVLSIGLPGFSTYTRGEDGEAKLLPGIREAITRWNPPRIFFLGDSDTSTNFEFSRNAVTLARLVHPLPVLLPRIPINGPGKGIDDCRASVQNRFPEFWQQLVENAMVLDAKASCGSLAVRFLEREKDALAASKDADRDKQMRRVVRVIAECHDDAISAERLAHIASEIFGVGIRSLKQAAQAEREEIRAKARAANPKQDKEWPRKFYVVEGEFGPPAFLSRDDEGNLDGGGQINQPFWAGLYAAENIVLHEPAEKRFYQYDDHTGIWSPESAEAIEQRISSRILSAARDYDDTLAFLEQTRSHRTLQAIVGHLRGVAEQRAPFARTRRFIHCANQMIEFEGGQAIPVGKTFAPDFYSRNALPVPFDPSAQCHRFLNELLLPATCPEDASLIQRWFGCAILQHNVPQRFLILDGAAGRGKSQLSVLAEKLVGACNTGALRTKHLDERFELFRLARKTLLIGADVPGNFLMHPHASCLKALVGGDPLEAEAKNSNESFTLYGHFNVLITCNERLTVRLESDAGAWRRRLLIIRFEAPPPRKKIDDFGALLFREEGCGILNWAIQGAVNLLHETATTGDYMLTAAQEKRIDDLLAESSSLELFVKDCIERTDEGNLFKDEIEEAYALFCEGRGFTPLPKRIQQSQIPELMLRFHHVSEANSVPRQMPDGTTKNQRGYRKVRINEIE